MQRLVDGPHRPTGDSESDATTDAATADEAANAPEPNRDTKPEEPSFGLVLQSFSGSKVNVILTIERLTGLSLIDSKRLVENAPSVVGHWETREQANEALRQLREEGTAVAIR